MKTFWTVIALGVVLMGSTDQASGQLASSDATTSKRPRVSCADCHEQQVEAFGATKMGRLMLNAPRTDLERQGCRACHGDATAHEQSGGEDKQGMITFTRNDRTPVVTRNATCLQCHEKTARTMWIGSTHEQAQVACTSCHVVMTADVERGHMKKVDMVATCAQCHPQRRAQQMRASHMPVGEGKMDCASCHNPHGTPNEKLLIAPTVNDVCYSCHTEKRGPFLWEHAPVVESCANCHDSHGSNHEKMLKVAKPRLCQQCHDETRHPTTAQTTGGTRYVKNRQCVNCHINIHGSNHPSAPTFTR
jgi:DmsE family decaheme c-type cytochrome